MNQILIFFSTFSRKTKKHFLESTFMTKWDYLAMGVLTLFFTILVFYRIGNTSAPQSAYTATSEDRDIVIDLGDYVDVGSIHMFLGNLNTRKFSISAFNEVTGAWEVLQGETAAESVFAWNTIAINYNLRYLGIVALDEECIINELVLTSPDGTILSPIYDAKYSALFDEQDLFPAVKTYLTGTMFDEVYHGRTAYEFIHGLVTYETTHPQLGKILISLGIRMFGMTPFGWRFMSALFGIFMVPLFYLFAKRLFQNTFAATATTILLVFDCMHFMLSRIATIDIFVAFFIILAYYYLYRYFLADHQYRQTSECLSDPFPPFRVAVLLALCGIGMSLAIATKLTGVYAAAGLAILFIWYTILHFPKQQTLRLFLFCIGFFVILPLVLYTLAYIPVVGADGYNGLIDKTIKNTRYMLWYHSTLKAEHYYSSPYYEWPIIWMPLLDANDAVSATKVSAVSCMGNPAIWWVGIPCVLITFIQWIARRDSKAGFLTIGYLAQYLPWVILGLSGGRITFIYHYFPAILFTILMMGYVIHLLLTKFPKSKIAITVYLVIAIACFFVFYPVVSGFPVSREYGMHLRLLKDWILVL